MKKSWLFLGILVSIFFLSFISALESYETILPQTPELIWTNQDVGANCEFLNSSVKSLYNPMNVPISVPWVNKKYLDKFFELYNYDGRIYNFPGFDYGTYRFFSSQNSSPCFITNSNWAVPDNDTWQKAFSEGYDLAVSYLDLSENERYWTSNAISFERGRGILELYINGSSKKLKEVVSPVDSQLAASWYDFCKVPWYASEKAYSTPRSDWRSDFNTIFPGFYIGGNISCPLASYRYVRCENEGVAQCSYSSTSTLSSSYTVCSKGVVKTINCGADESCLNGKCECNPSTSHCLNDHTVSSCNYSSRQWVTQKCEQSICSDVYEKTSRCVATCSSQNGYVCSEDERCNGVQVSAEDSNRCCSTPCVTPTPKKCSDCGWGMYNVCDKAECENLVEQSDDGCIFLLNSGFSGLFGRGSCVVPENCLVNNSFSSQCVGKLVCSGGNCKDLKELKSCYGPSDIMHYSPLDSNSYYILSTNLSNIESVGSRGPCIGVTSSENIVINGMGNKVTLDSGSGSLGSRVGIQIVDSKNILIKNVELDANSSLGAFYPDWTDGVVGVNVSNSENIYFLNNLVKFRSPNSFKNGYVGINTLNSRNLSLIGNVLNFDFSGQNIPCVGFNLLGWNTNISNIINNSISMNSGIAVNSLCKIGNFVGNSISVDKGIGVNLIGEGSYTNPDETEFICSNLDNNVIRVINGSGLDLSLSLVVFGNGNLIDKINFNSGFLKFNSSEKSFYIDRPVTLSSYTYQDLFDIFKLNIDGSISIANFTHCPECNPFNGSNLFVSVNRADLPLPSERYYGRSSDCVGAVGSTNLNVDGVPVDLYSSDRKISFKNSVLNYDGGCFIDSPMELIIKL